MIVKFMRVFIVYVKSLKLNKDFAVKCLKFESKGVEDNRRKLICPLKESMVYYCF